MEVRRDEHLNALIERKHNGLVLAAQLELGSARGLMDPDTMLDCDIIYSCCYVAEVG